VSTTERTNQTTFTAFDERKLRQQIPDLLTLCHVPIEQKIKRDWSNLRAAGLDYDDLVGHILELITAVKESGEANPALVPEPASKIMATRSQGSGTNVLRLKLVIE
jgi:hypothetical protein